MTTNNTFLELTVLPLASKDVMVMLSHGLWGVNGATTAIIK